MAKTKIIKCRICGKEREVKLSNHSAKFCSRKCQYIAKRGNIVDRKKIYCKHCDKEILVYPSDNRKKYCSRKCMYLGRTGYKWSSTMIKKIADKTKEAMSTDAIRSKQLNGILKHFNDHPNSGNLYETGKIYLSRFEKEVRYRSSYEKKAYSIFNSILQIVDLDVENLRIEYYTDKLHYYIPDCVIDLITGERIIVEVKAKKLMSTELNIIKFDAANVFSVQYGYLFCVMTEDDLLDKNSVETKLAEVIQQTTATIPRQDDDIVRTVLMEKVQRQAEMTCPPNGGMV